MAVCAYVWFAATKNADQTMAVWRMVQKVAFVPVKQSLAREFAFEERGKPQRPRENYRPTV